MGSSAIIPTIRQRWKAGRLGTLVQATAAQPEFPLPLISLMNVSVWFNLENERDRNGLGITNQDETWEMTSI